MKKVSYIIAHRNRCDLLEQNLISLQRQTSNDFEVVIADNSDDINKRSLRTLVLKYCNSLDIQCVFVKPEKHPYAKGFSGQLQKNMFNPALQQNICAKIATGDVLVLTSPEVVNANTNVERIINLTEGKNKYFYLGWIDELPKQNVDINSLTESYIKELCKTPGKWAKCRNDANWSVKNYFLGIINRDDFLAIGGIEEKYMQGIGYEDDEFAQRLSLNEFDIQLKEEICGIHLSHPRDYQPAGLAINKPLWLEDERQKRKVANVGFAFGSDKFVMAKV